MAKPQMTRQQGSAGEQGSAQSSGAQAETQGRPMGRTGRGLHPSARRASKKWSQVMTEGQLTRSLGWFSIGLGLAEVVAPRGLGRLIGVRGNQKNLMRMLGLRELASGVGILSQQRPAGFLWSRVGGDAMDLALLGAAMTSPKSNRSKLAMATLAVAGVTALDVICSQQLSQPADTTTEQGAMRVKQTITINRSPEEIYRFWRDFQNLPRFMNHLESVETIGQSQESAAGQTAGQSANQTSGDKRSHWVAKATAGGTVEWDAEITEDRPNELIAWRSLEGADVDNAGTVRFEQAPGKRGTLVSVEMLYNPPAGAVGATVARLFGEDPKWQVKDDLRRFKQMMEVGEVITTEGQAAGRGSSTSWRYDTAVSS